MVPLSDLATGSRQTEMKMTIISFICQKKNDFHEKLHSRLVPFFFGVISHLQLNQFEGDTLEARTTLLLESEWYTWLITGIASGATNSVTPLIYYNPNRIMNYVRHQINSQYKERSLAIKDSLPDNFHIQWCQRQCKKSQSVDQQELRLWTYILPNGCWSQRLA